MDKVAERYDRKYNYGSVEFYLADFIPDQDQCRFLILKVLEQAIRDYTTLQNAKTPNEQNIWKEARDFIFDDNYIVSWGDLDLRTEEFLDLVDLDIVWVREQTIAKLKRGK